MTLELGWYLIYFIFGLLSINQKTHSTTILLWFFSTSSLLLIVHLQEPMWDMVSYQKYSRIDNFEGNYFKREIIYFKTMHILSDVFSFRGALLIIDLLLMSLVLRTFILLKIPIIYWYAFFCCFWSIMGYQNIHRQYVSAVLLMWLFAEFIHREVRNKALVKTLIALMIPFVHNIAGVSLVLLFRSVFKRIYFIIIPFTFIIIVILMDYMVGTRSSQPSGSNFAYVYYTFFAFAGFMYIKRSGDGLVDIQMFKSLYLLSLSIYTVALVLLAVAGQERVGHFFVIVFFPYLMLGIRNTFKQKKLIDTGLLVSLHVPIYFTGAFKFLVT